MLVGTIAHAFAPVLTAPFVDWDHDCMLEAPRANLGDPLRYFHTSGRVDPY